MHERPIARLTAAGEDFTWNARSSSILGEIIVFVDRYSLYIIGLLP